jgi:hypothetical protein
VANSCEHDIEYSNFIKGREFVASKATITFTRRNQLWNISWLGGWLVSEIDIAGNFLIS